MSTVSEACLRMRVCVVSRDADLVPQLSEFGEIVVLPWEPAEEIPQADLYIWEFESSPDVLQQVARRDDAQHLVIGNSELHMSISSSLPDYACMLPRAVAPNTLRAFIALASSTCREQKEARRVSDSRNGRDPLLPSLREITSKLQQCDPQRERLIARAIHDFRSSLTSLNGCCGLLIDEAAGSGERVPQADLIRCMQYSVDRLTRFSADVIHLLAFGSISKNANSSRNNVETCVTRSLASLRSLIAGKNISVKIALEQSLLPFESGQMERLFSHLLENVCKFTPDNGAIEIEGYAVGKQPGSTELQRPMDDSRDGVDGYRIDITDSGESMSSESAETLFDLDAPYGSNPRAGGGLGLTICKSIVDSLAGTIWAVPRESGGQISLVLPLFEKTAADDKDSLRLLPRVN